MLRTRELVRPATTDVHTVQIGSFEVVVTGAACVVDLIREAFPSHPGWSTPHTNGHGSRLHVHEDGDDTWQVIEGDALLRHCHTLDELQAYLVWLIVSRAVERLGSDHLLFHAAAISVGQAGIILPANSGSGKSTLTAALVAAGATYFSDEIAAIEAGAGSLVPFPKAIKLEPDTLPVLSSRYPELADRRLLDRRATYVRPPVERWASEPVSPQFVIFPRYRAGAPTQLRSISRSVAFERLLEQAFSTGGQAGDGIQQIVHLIQMCSCHDLTFSDLDCAVDLVTHIAG